MNELNNDEDRKKAFDYITQHYEDILRKQFQLAYFSHISVSDSDNMDIYEFKMMHKIMLDQLKFEKEERDRALSSK